MGFLQKIAPFLSGALSLGGPLGAMAGNALSAALGAKPGATVDSIVSSLSKIALTPEQIAAVQKAEQDFQVQMKQLDIQSVEDLEKLASDDRKDARAMQTQTKSFIPGILASVITLGFFVLLGGMMFGKLKVVDNQALLLMLGALQMAFGGVINYYFGSSAGSDRKTEIIANGNGKPH